MNPLLLLLVCLAVLFCSLGTFFFWGLPPDRAHALKVGTMFCCCFVWGSDNFIQKQQRNDYGRVLSCLVCLTNGRIRVKHARAATPPSCPLIFSAAHSSLGCCDPFPSVPTASRNSILISPRNDWPFAQKSIGDSSAFSHHLTFGLLSTFTKCWIKWTNDFPVHLSKVSAWKTLARKILGETFLGWWWLPLVVALPCDRLGAVEKSNILRRLPCCERAMRVESYRVPPLRAPLAIVGLPSCYLSYPSLLFYTRAQPSYKHTFRSSDMLLFFPLSFSLFLWSNYIRPIGDRSFPG